LFSLDKIIFKLLFLPVILLALTVHEFAHGYVAYLRGDRTAKDMGRLTLNPLPHIDIIGLLFLMFFNFGWAKPVPINPANFKTPKKDEIMVALAGVTANLICALCLGLLFRFADFSIFGQTGEIVQKFTAWGILINCGLAVFNLIPVPPLDGSHVLRELLPYRAAVKYIVFFSNPAVSWILLGIFIFLPGLITPFIIGPVLFLSKIFAGGGMLAWLY